MKSKAQIPATPLQKIALSCSGGGYRASSFHLGTMAYLQRLRYRGGPLLENVKMLSTVSGGTITGVIYALQKQEGKSFEEIYHFILHKLNTLDLIRIGLEKLNPQASWTNTHKRKNLINAFAEIYDQEFTNGATLKELRTMKSHLEAVSFNSTEFKSGVNFRFRNSNTGFVGNGTFRIDRHQALEIKLADAIAASSCFPVGFEPIMWPHDFVHDGASRLMTLAKDASESIGIMDGGIYDNQGIDSILLYKDDFHEEDENNGQPYFDLIILSDVASPDVKAFVPKSDQAKTGFRNWTVEETIEKMRGVNRLIDETILGWAFFFWVLPAPFCFPNNMLTGISVGLGTVALAIFFLKRYLLKQAETKIKGFWNSEKRKSFLPFYMERLARLDYKKLSIRRLEPLLMDRCNSVFTLLNDVFLKIVRSLNYRILYRNDLYEFRRISSLIKELAQVNFEKRTSQDESENTSRYHFFFKGTFDDSIGDNIREVAESASSFGTKLWFTEQEFLNNMLKKLVATGQFTLCYNMINYLESLFYTKGNGYANLDDVTKRDLHALYQQCKDDWARFKDDPLFLVTEMEKTTVKG